MRHKWRLQYNPAPTKEMLGGVSANRIKLTLAELEAMPDNGSNGDYRPYKTRWNYQRGENNEESDGCPNFSQRNNDDLLGGFQGEVPDYSVSYNYKDSGTLPGEGNTYEAPIISLQNHWACPEADRPFIGGQTPLSELLAEITPTQQTAAASQLKLWSKFEYELPDTSQSTIRLALRKIGPVRVGMDGDYVPENLILAPPNYIYDHVNTIVAIDENNNFVMDDSEYDDWETVAQDYQFQVAYAYSLKKTPMFIKLANNAALFSPSPTEIGPTGKPALIPYEIGDVYKLVNQTTTYNNIKTYPTLQSLLQDYDFGTWEAAKIPWDSQAFINSLGATPINQ